MDDDVQYLGTKLAVPEPLADPCESSPSVTGITIHVEKCGDKPAHDLTFYRASSSYVNIGRKSGSDDKSMRRENDSYNVVFTCQVVSARHAKLVLSDSGQVYIVDLHSRHGTHLLRRGETSPRMLPAEIETPLADGDVLTFGKVVGAGSYHVSPVTVRVELLTSQPSAEPPADRALTLSRPLSPAPVLFRTRRLNSGCYGLHAASCAESDSSHSSSSISMSPDVASSPSEQESDVEDEHSCIPTLLRDSQGKTSVKIPAFRSFIRDIYHNTALHSPVILDVSDEPLEDDPATPPSTDAARPPSPVVVVIEPFSKSRSHSPMEVATPSPSPPSDVQQSEPAVIGAWPASRPESPRHSLLEVESERSEVAPAPELDRKSETVTVAATCQNRPPLSNDAFIELMHRLPPPPPFFTIGGPFSTSITSDFGLPSVPPPPPPPLHRMPPLQPLHRVVTESVKSEIKESLKNAEDRMTALQDTVSDLVSRQSATEDDVIDLQSRVEMLEPESESLLCRIGGAERNIASLSMLQGQMAALQNQATMLRERLDALQPRPVETPMDDFRACANALNSLVSEMKSLREDMEKRIEAKMEAIQSARAEALDALKEVVAEAESVRSLKRKRDDEETEEEAPTMVAPLDVTMEPVACSPPLVVEDVPLIEVSTPTIAQISLSMPVPEICASEVPAIEPSRPKKRARTAMYTVARTAAAMVVGAAATWSALAFS